MKLRQLFLLPDSYLSIDLCQHIDGFEKLKLRFQQSAFLDIRNSEIVNAGHLLQCGHIPAEQLPERMAELPHKNISLVIVSESISIENTVRFLDSRKYKIKACLITDNVTNNSWLKLIENNLAGLGKISHILWEANKFLQHQIHKIENKLHNQTGKALDIGCGSAREAVFLARRGWQVKAVDNLPEAIQRANNLAKYNEVDIETFEEDIINGSINFQNDAFDLIIMFRFLDRPLFERIKNWLKPGGFFLCETFSVEAAKFGKPRRKSLLLNPGEIKQYFSDYEVSEDYHRTLSDGRPLIGTIVRKY